MLYIYMPIIRKSIFTFVRTWNSHLIRKQSNRKHVVSGRPTKLYNHNKDVKDCGYVPDEAFLDELDQIASAWGMYEASFN